MLNSIPISRPKRVTIQVIVFLSKGCNGCVWNPRTNFEGLPFDNTWITPSSGVWKMDRVSISFYLRYITAIQFLTFSPWFRPYWKCSSWHLSWCLRISFPGSESNLKKVDESNDFSCSLSVLPHRLKNCVTWNHNCFVPNFDKIRSTPHPSFIATCSRKAYLNVPMFGWGVSIFFKYRVLSKELTILFNLTQQELLNANFVL